MRYKVKSERSKLKVNPSFFPSPASPKSFSKVRHLRDSIYAYMRALMFSIELQVDPVE